MADFSVSVRSFTCQMTAKLKQQPTLPCPSEIPGTTWELDAAIEQSFGTARPSTTNGISNAINAYDVRISHGASVAKKAASTTSWSTSGRKTRPRAFFRRLNDEVQSLPGLRKSELARELDGLRVRAAKFLLARTAEQGSRSLTAGAVGGPDTHGQYLDMGKVTTPATVVVGRGGAEIQTRLYTELMEKLEVIAPGVTQNNQT
ncbi:Retinol dehydrogenase 13 [Apiospora marii]|uniref:Retinol dehydrogenase 13 n=1 Tax=Apiospora marii TaxID=335849 RepID=A0ABR1R139_9PEZI